MAKRANGEGSISKRSDGLWRGRVTLGRDDNGKLVKRDVYAKSQTECREKVDLLKTQIGRKLNFKTGTLAQYLQHWLENVVKINLATTTYEEYELAVRLYITPYIGHRPLAKLDAEDLEAWQAKLKRQGKSNNIRDRSIRVLRNAMNKAVKGRKLDFNPILALDKPKVERREVEPLELELCKSLFAACESYRLGDIIPLAVMTGLRMGELLGLEWSDINLSEGVLSVRRALQQTKEGLSLKAPKSKAGRRVVTLEPLAIQALQNRLKKAKDEGMPPEHIPIVFPNTLGKHQFRGELNRQTWYPIRKVSGIPQSTRFHDLRHSHASLMIAAGIHLKVIQERLGHSTFELTANTYSHLLQGAQADAADRVGKLVGAVVGAVDTEPQEVESTQSQ